MAGRMGNIGRIKTMPTLNQSAPAAAPSKADKADGHYYSYTTERGWFPLYEGESNFTLKQARELASTGQVAVPSATGYIGCMRKYQVEEYDKKNAARVARDTPMDDRFADEDAWLDQVLSVASTASHAARDKGSSIHKATEKFLAGEEYDANWQPYVTAIITEMDKLGIRDALSETCVGSLKYGVGGKVDLSHDASLTIGDIKTRGHRVNKVKPSKVPSYETDEMQIACYGFCRYGNEFFRRGRGVILGVSTLIPGLVTPHEFSGKDLVPAFEAFLALTAVWRFTNGHDPRVLS